MSRELRQVDEYEAAYRAWREDRKPWPLKGPPVRYPKREELMGTALGSAIDPWLAGRLGGGRAL